MPRSLAWLALALSASLWAAAAAAPQRPPPDGRTEADPARSGRPALRVFTDRDGLPQNAISALAVDRKGYLWAGTQDGAAYYNGRVWTVVNMPNRAASNWVTDILAGSDGALWFATRGGVARLEGASWSTYDTRSGLPNDEVTALVETSDGAVWAGTEEGLARWDRSVWTSVNAGSRPAHDNIRCLLETRADDGRSVLWAGTERGGLLRRAPDGAWTRIGVEAGLPDDRVYALLETRGDDGGSVLWAATFGGGVARLERGAWTSYSVKDGLPSIDALTLFETSRPDGTRTLWVGTLGGLGRFENGRWTTYDTKAGLPVDGIWSLMETPSPSGTRLLWVGTNGGGLVRLDLGGWVSFDRASGLPNEAVYSVLDGSSQTLWVGTNGGGLAGLKDGKWVVYDKRSGLPDDSVLSVLETSATDGAPVLWVGTYSGGLARFAHGSWTTFDVTSGLPDNHVSCLLEAHMPDGTRVLFAGTRDGLASFDDRSWRTLDAELGLPDRRVQCLLETTAPDGTHTLWVGTRGGLARCAPGGTTIYAAGSGLPANPVLGLTESVAIDGRRFLWAGTQGAGVARLDLTSPNGQWTVFSDSSVPALPNNVIYQIREDARGRIYLSTNKGVVRLTPRAPTPDDPSEYDLYSFTTEDGLPSNECNSGASTVDRRGRVWVGTITGVAMLDPSKEVDARSPKPLVIERSRLARSGTDLTPSASLAYDESDLVFEFALLSFAHEGGTRYRTELVGFDPRPSAWGADAKKEYTSLPAGRYVFRVWGRDAAGAIAGPAEIAFSIRPAPWRTWWAYVLYAVAVAGLLFVGVRRRERALNRRNEALEARIAERTAQLGEKVEQLGVSEQAAHESELRAIEASRAKSVFLANMSHELRTPLNAILGFAQVMSRRAHRDAADREHLSVILRSGEHLLSLINNVLSISKIEAGKMTVTERSFDLRRLLRDIDEMVLERAESKALRLVLDVDATVPRVVRGDDGKLRQVLLNLLANAVKFTEAGQVGLRVSWNDGRAAFEVSDTGEGIAEEELGGLFRPFVQAAGGLQTREGTGLGLAISQEFVRLMGGRISVRSASGRGTTFRFEIGLPQADEASIGEGRQSAVGLEPGQARLRLLVADDNPENRDVLVHVLAPFGFEVREATGGAEAVAAWAEWRPHLIWMDMSMPEVDGYEAVRRIRETEAGEPERRPCPIIAVTASAFEHERGAILKAGCNDVVIKPFRENEILSMLASHAGVRFVYEADGAEAQDATGMDADAIAQRLRDLPSEWVAELQAAADRGNARAVGHAIVRIRERDPVLAERLDAMAQDFAFEQIVRLASEGDATP